jgi:hypothetical protein
MMQKIYSGFDFCFNFGKYEINGQRLCCLVFMNAAIDQQCEFIKKK